jgi:hypothetical protein
MKREILDIRVFVAIVLVVITLIGQRFSELSNMQPDTQNLKFISTSERDVLSLK